MQPNIVTDRFLLFLSFFSSFPFFSSDLPSFLSFVLPLSVSFWVFQGWGVRGAELNRGDEFTYNGIHSALVNISIKPLKTV